jgi:hypothetical protein
MANWKYGSMHSCIICVLLKSYSQLDEWEGVTIAKMVGRVSMILTITATTRKSTTSLQTTLIYFEGYCPVGCEVHSQPYVYIALISSIWPVHLIQTFLSIIDRLNYVYNTRHTVLWTILNENVARPSAHGKLLRIKVRGIRFITSVKSVLLVELPVAGETQKRSQANISVFTLALSSTTVTTRATCVNNCNSAFRLQSAIIV